MICLGAVFLRKGHKVGIVATAVTRGDALAEIGHYLGEVSPTAIELHPCLVGVYQRRADGSWGLLWVGQQHPHWKAA